MQKNLSSIMYPISGLSLQGPDKKPLGSKNLITNFFKYNVLGWLILLCYHLLFIYHCLLRDLDLCPTFISWQDLAEGGPNKCRRGTTSRGFQASLPLVTEQPLCPHRLLWHGSLGLNVGLCCPDRCLSLLSLLWCVWLHSALMKTVREIKEGRNVIRIWNIFWSSDTELLFFYTTLYPIWFFQFLLRFSCYHSLFFIYLLGGSLTWSTGLFRCSSCPLGHFSI